MTNGVAWKCGCGREHPQVVCYCDKCGRYQADTLLYSKPFEAERIDVLVDYGDGDPVSIGYSADTSEVGVYTIHIDPNDLVGAEYLTVVINAKPD